jgi:hypothetical protein
MRGSTDTNFLISLENGSLCEKLDIATTHEPNQIQTAQITQPGVAQLTLMHQTLPQNFHDLSKDASKIDGNLKRS